MVDSSAVTHRELAASFEDRCDAPFVCRVTVLVGLQKLDPECRKVDVEQYLPEQETTLIFSGYFDYYLAI
jgi:hypothetical protein